MGTMPRSSCLPRQRHCRCRLGLLLRLLLLLLLRRRRQCSTLPLLLLRLVLLLLRPVWRQGAAAGTLCPTQPPQRSFCQQAPPLSRWLSRRLVLRLLLCLLLLLLLLSCVLLALLLSACCSHVVCHSLQRGQHAAALPAAACATCLACRCRPRPRATAAACGKEIGDRPVACPRQPAACLFGSLGWQRHAVGALGGTAVAAACRRRCRLAAAAACHRRQGRAAVHNT